MEIFRVGGAVRDQLLGRPSHDQDFVVVGATEEEFLIRFPAAKKVGKSFPVYLVDGHEFAFARTEVSSGDGHIDFEVNFSADVTLEEDLNRRDLTINSLAENPVTYDLYGDRRGFKDLENRILRHTSPAFEDDPLRVFRVARFAATLEGFTVAPETITLMASMSESLSTLSPTRVFTEMKKALSGCEPRRFFEVLRETGCLYTWFPEITSCICVPAGPNGGKHKGEEDTFEHILNVMTNVPSKDPVLRFAGLCHDLGKALSESPPLHHGHDKAGLVPVESLCNRLIVPKIWRKNALIFCEEHIRMHRVQEMRQGKAVKLLLKAEKSMVGGLQGFLDCSIGDGMTESEALEITIRAYPVFQVKLPEKYHGLGKACAEIMTQLQGDAWRKEKSDGKTY